MPVQSDGSNSDLSPNGYLCTEYKNIQNNIGL